MTRLLRQFVLLTMAVALTTIVGCGSQPGIDTDSETATRVASQWPTETGLAREREHCDPLPGEVIGGGSFVFAVTDSVLPERAPVPHNPAERVVFANLYETLVTVDCQGEVQPGLADQWSCTEDSTVWVFSIREGAVFWDGTRVTAPDIKTAWATSQDCPSTDANASPWSWFQPKSRSVDAVDNRRLAIHLPEPQARFPMLLAHPATAVAVRRPGWTWPVGTGPCRLSASTPEPLPELRCRPNTHHPRPPVWKHLVFHVLPQRDRRDLAATDTDLLLLRNQDERRFFADVPGFRTVPLPWDRLVLLVCPPEQNAPDSRRWSDPVGQLDVAGGLTDVDARPWPDLVFPAGADGPCPQLTGPVAAQRAARRDWHLAAKHLDGDVLAYPTDDPAARELAHRLSALADAQVRAVALVPEALDFALTWQMAGAFIVSFDQQYPTGCLQLAALLGKAAWLQRAALDLPDPDAPTGGGADDLVQAHRMTASEDRDPSQTLLSDGLALPLALTRPWLVVRGDLAGIQLTYDGVPLLGGLGLAAAPRVTP